MTFMAGQSVQAGVDGCKAGWIAVLEEDRSLCARVFQRFADIVDFLSPNAVIAVDMPIGLPDRVGHGGRGPEGVIRPLLGQRQSSVFSIPSRSAVYAEAGPFADAKEFRDAHSRASTIARLTSDPARAISIQAFGLFPKIREIDTLMMERQELRERVIESHPELAFWRLNGERAMALPKKIKGTVNPNGMEERKTLLAAHGLPRDLLDLPPPKGAGADDLLDAAAMYLIAARHARGATRPFPHPPLRDPRGIPIAIWA